MLGLDRQPPIRIIGAGTELIALRTARQHRRIVTTDRRNHLQRLAITRIECHSDLDEIRHPDLMPNRRSLIKLPGWPIDGSAVPDLAGADDEEKAESNERVPCRLIYPIAGREVGAALDTAFNTLAS